jgi:lysozyme family protein
MDLQKTFKQIEKWEGSDLENVENDLGGLTNTGITFSNYLAKCRLVFGVPPTLDHFKLLKSEEIYKIYNFMWSNTNVDKIKSDKLKVCIFDFIFNSQFARREIQTFLNGQGFSLDEDNVFGKKSLAAINKYLEKNGESKTLNTFFNIREIYLKKLIIKNPTQKRFLEGWTNRINDLKRFINDTL